MPTVHCHERHLLTERGRMNELKLRPHIFCLQRAQFLAAVEPHGALVASNVPGLFESEKMLGGCEAGRASAPGCRWEAAGKAISPPQLHFVFPFPFFTYAKTADSSGDLSQVQTVKNNLLNTFLDALKSKTFLSLVQPSLQG